MYTPTPEQLAQNDRAFRYHPPHVGQPERYTQIRAQAGELAHRLCTLCPPSRELSLALTSIEQAVMWANASIARHETPPSEPADAVS